MEAVKASLLDGKQQKLFKEKKGGQVIYFGGWNNGIVGLIRTIHTCERFMTPKVFVAERFNPQKFNRRFNNDIDIKCYIPDVSISLCQNYRS